MYSQLIYNYFNLTNFIQRSRGKYLSITVPEKHRSTCFETMRRSGNQLFNIKPHSIQFWLSFRSINNLPPESLFRGTETETLISSLELYVSACSGLGFLTKRLKERTKQSAKPFFLLLVLSGKQCGTVTDKCPREIQTKWPESESTATSGNERTRLHISRRNVHSCPIHLN